MHTKILIPLMLAAVSCCALDVRAEKPAKADAPGSAAESTALPKAVIDGTELGWRALEEKDFANVNCDPDTWKWQDGVIHCKGQPVGVIRMTKLLTNFELVVQWKLPGLEETV